LLLFGIKKKKASGFGKSRGYDKTLARIEAASFLKLAKF
jgi:hypothetical protein